MRISPRVTLTTPTDFSPVQQTPLKPSLASPPLAPALSVLVEKPGIKQVASQVLLGQPMPTAGALAGAQEATALRQVVTRAEADALMAEMAALKFTNQRGELVPVPYNYPIDGCEYRAALVQEALAGKGIASERVIATALDEPFLSHTSLYTQDGWDRVFWMNHTAPIIWVADGAGPPVQMVLDPLASDKPILIDDWLASYSDASQFTHWSAEDVKKSVADGILPWDLKHKDAKRPRFLVFTSDAAQFPGNGWNLGLDGVIPSHDRVIEEATWFADLAAIQTIAGAIRIFRDSHDDVPVLQVIAAQPKAARDGLWKAFPRLAEQFNAMNGPEKDRIAAALAQP